VVLKTSFQQVGRKERVKGEISQNGGVVKKERETGKDGNWAKIVLVKKIKKKLALQGGKWFL